MSGVVYRAESQVFKLLERLFGDLSVASQHRPCGESAETGGGLVMDKAVSVLASNEIGNHELRLTATKPEELDPVLGFLTSIFQMPLSARFVSPGIFHWKYFTRRPDWDGPRSYVLRDSNSLVAHIGLWPVRFRSPVGHLAGVQALDWAASRQHPKAGSHLRVALEELADFGLGIGGTIAAQQARARLGFQPWTKLSIFRLVIRPWLKFRKVRTGSRFRRLGRWGRDLLHAPGSVSLVGSSWSAHLVESFDESLEKVLSLPEPGELRSYRSSAVLNYFLACPGSNCRGVVFSCRGSACGYALLTRLAGQARIAALWAPNDWESAYRLTTEIISMDPTVYEIIAGVSSSVEKTALLQSGYRVHDSRPIALKDASRVVPSSLEPCVQLADSDAFFL